MQNQSYERVNILLPKQTAKRLRRVIPRGQRSKMISQAIDEKLSQINRKDAYQELLGLRKGMPKVSMEEVVKWVRKDRRSH